jgi:uncharacterized protein YjdB
MIIMKKTVSQILALSTCGLFLTSGAVVQSAVAMDDQGSSHTSMSVGSQSSDGMSDVRENPKTDFGTKWSDQLIRERDEAKTSKEQAQKAHDQAKKERDEAQQANVSAGQKKSIQAKSGSGTEKQARVQLVKERDQYLQERDDLQRETANFRQERDRAMSSLSGGSALDAVDSSMPSRQGIDAS